LATQYILRILHIHINDVLQQTMWTTTVMAQFQFCF